CKSRACPDGIGSSNDVFDDSPRDTSSAVEGGSLGVGLGLEGSGFVIGSVDVCEPSGAAGSPLAGLSVTEVAEVFSSRGETLRTVNEALGSTVNAAVNAI